MIFIIKTRYRILCVTKITDADVLFFLISNTPRYFSFAFNKIIYIIFYKAEISFHNLLITQLCYRRDPNLPTNRKKLCYHKNL